MTFFLSKFLWYLFNPFNLILFLLILSIVFNFFKFFKFSKIIFYFTFLLFFITGVLPTGSYLLYLLEKNFHNKINLPENINGILILSGATNPFLTKEYGQISLNGSVERLIDEWVSIAHWGEVNLIATSWFQQWHYPNHQLQVVWTKLPKDTKDYPLYLTSNDNPVNKVII